MTEKSVSSIRLAHGTDRPSLLFNTYHLLTQMAALYAHVCQFVATPTQKALVDAIGDELIQDLGALYTAWEGIDKINLSPMEGHAKLAKRITVASGHYAALLRLLGAWTSFPKLASVLSLSERKWCRILKALTVGAGKEASVLNVLIKRSETRCHQMAGELQKCKLTDRLTQDAFDAADQALLDKSFGF